MCKQEVKLGREQSKDLSPALFPPQEEAGQVLLLKGGVYWDSPSYGSSCVWKKSKNCQLVNLSPNLPAQLQLELRARVASKIN